MIISITSTAQCKDFSVIKDTSFPNTWDKNRNLRGRNGLVLAWAHFKSGKKDENKSCIDLVYGPDSIGNIEYFISEMYTDEKPFNKWNCAWIHYSNYLKDSATGLTFGFYDTHIEKFTHKPTAKELYDLLLKWRFYLINDDSITIEAGIDETLWLNTFGFPVDKTKFITTK